MYDSKEAFLEFWKKIEHKLLNLFRLYPSKLQRSKLF